MKRWNRNLMWQVGLKERAGSLNILSVNPGVTLIKHRKWVVNADATEIRNMIKENLLWADMFGYLDRKLRQDSICN